MIARSLAALLLATALLHAAADARAAGAPMGAAASPTQRRHASGASTRATTRHAAPTSGGHPAPAASPAHVPGYPPKAGAPRRLEDIRIEGEIPVPQVLFITARDQRRFMEFQHHRYQRTSLELGRATTLPSPIVVPRSTPVEPKEEQR